MAELKSRVVGGKVSDLEKSVVEWAAHDAGRTTSQFVAAAALDAAMEQLARSQERERPEAAEEQQAVA